MLFKSRPFDFMIVWFYVVVRSECATAGRNLLKFGTRTAVFKIGDKNGCRKKFSKWRTHPSVQTGGRTGLCDHIYPFAKTNKALQLHRTRTM